VDNADLAVRPRPDVSIRGSVAIRPARGMPPVRSHPCALSRELSSMHVSLHSLRRNSRSIIPRSDLSSFIDDVIRARARAREMSGGRTQGARSMARIRHRGQVFRGYGAAARFGN